MFHSPVSIDAERSEADLSAESGGAGNFDVGNERLRQAHLHNGQVTARALFAPYFAITAVAAALVTGWAMFGSVNLELVVGWVATLAFANWVSCRRAMEAAARGTSRTARPRAGWFAVVEAVGLAALWSALPTYAFATQPPHVQVVIGGAMAAMITSAIALAAIPAAAVAWIATLTAAFCLAYYFGSATLDPKLALTFMLLAGAGAFSVAAAHPLDFRPLKGLARTRAEAESIRQLLNEYEHRGVGWLWQVDSREQGGLHLLADDRFARPLDQPAGRPFAARGSGRNQRARPHPPLAPALRQSGNGAARLAAAPAGSASRAIRSSTWPASSRVSAASART